MFGSHFETAAHQWVVDSYPEPLRFKDALDISEDEADIEDWSVVPSTYPGLLNWAYVGRNPVPLDHTRNLLFLYKTPHLFPSAPANALYPVGIRVQGYVQKCNLRPTGNWDGTSPPQGALQYLVLSGGQQYGDVFGQYISGLDHVKAFIFRCLNQSHPAPSSREELYLARRVFTKVTTANRGKASVLDAGDDPMGVCERVAQSWRILNKINVGMYLPGDVHPEDGTTVPCEPLSIVEGDFVDVCIGFDIVTRYFRSQAHHQIHLTIEHILLLRSGEGNSEAMTVDIIPSIHAPGLSFT